MRTENMTPTRGCYFGRKCVSIVMIGRATTPTSLQHHSHLLLLLATCAEPLRAAEDFPIPCNTEKDHGSPMPAAEILRTAVLPLGFSFSDFAAERAARESRKREGFSMKT